MGEHLRPVEIPRTDRFDEDLVSIPKYSGKTNEQFTRLLTNITLAVVERRADGVQTGHERALRADRVERRLAHAGHDPHGDRDVGRVGQLDADV